MLYTRITERIRGLSEAELQSKDICEVVWREFGPHFDHPPTGSFDGPWVRPLRTLIAETWDRGLNRAENVCFLNGWLMNTCINEEEELHHSLSLLDLEAARVHPEETFHRLTVLMSVSMPSGILNIL